jgi:hypothetical protein
LTPPDFTGGQLADGYCDCGGSDDCCCELSMYRPSTLDGKPIAKPIAVVGEVVLYTTATIYKNNLTLVFKELPKFKTSKLKQKKSLKLGKDSCKQLGYKSIEILPGNYVFRGNTMVVNVKLGPKVG